MIFFSFFFFSSVHAAGECSNNIAHCSYFPRLGHSKWLYNNWPWPDHLTSGWSSNHSKTAWGGKGCGQGMEVEGERELIIIIMSGAYLFETKYPDKSGMQVARSIHLDVPVIMTACKCPHGLNNCTHTHTHNKINTWLSTLDGGWEGIHIHMIHNLIPLQC